MFFQWIYNPNILGMSVGWSLPLDAVPWGNSTLQPWDPPITVLNGAQSGAKIVAVPAQVDYITNQIETTFSGTINMKKDWKLLTLFIGPNNVCSSCDDDYNPDYYEKELRLILNKVYAQLPRTFVSIVLLFNISQVYDIAMESDYCQFMWDTFCASECPCIHKGIEGRQIMDNTTVQYNERIVKVAKEWQEKNLTEFTVKVQPFVQNLNIPLSYGLHFLSELDCFHPSWRADDAWAVGYWNNLMTEDKYKYTDTAPETILWTCPDENTVLH